MKENYKTKSPMIYFPDISVDNLVQLYRSVEEDEYENTVKRLKSYLNEEVDKFMFVSFIFLHEVGHWKQLEDDGYLVHKFLDRNYEEEKSNFEGQKSIISSVLKRTGKNTQATGLELTERDKSQLRELQEEYRRIPKEKEADDYAINMLKSENITETFLNNLINCK